MNEQHGTLKKTSLPRLLHIIYSANDPAAVLEVTREPVKKRFYFKNGEPVAASSNVLGEVLGRLLLAEGIITQKDYENSLEIVLKEKKRHGEVLISQGLITAGELDAFLALQLKKRLFKLFAWNEGEYAYTSEDKLPPGTPEEPVSAPRLILDGISLGHYPLVWLKNDLSLFMNKRLAVSPARGRYNLEDFGLTIQETRFFNSFNGKKTLEETLTASDLLSHRALSLSLTFIITGLLKIEGIEKEAPKAAEKPKPAEAARPTAVVGPDERVNAEIRFMKAKTAITNGAFKEASVLLTEIIKLNPAEAEYRAYLGWALFNAAPNDAGEAAKAEKLLKEALNKNNELAEAWFFLGTLLLAGAKEDEAVKAFSSALAKDAWMTSAVAGIKCAEISLAEKGKLPPPEAEAKNRYVKFFGLATDPFAAAPSAPMDRWLSLTAEQKLRLEQIITCFVEKPGPILIQGRDGVGKTIMMLEFLRALSGKKYQAALLLKPPAKELDFIKEVNAEFKRSMGRQGAKAGILTQGARAALGDAGAATETNAVKIEMERLGMLLEQIHLQGGNAVLIIDHAHQLSAQCMKLVAGLSKLSGLRMIFAGDPGFALKLKEPVLRLLDRALTSRFSVQKTFTKEETKAYVLKRLNSVKRTGALKQPELTVTEEAFDAVCHNSYGIPGMINRLCSHILAKAAELNKTTIDKDIASVAH